MKVIYARQPFPNTCRKSVFLAGPTPRLDRETGRPNAASWRPEAICILGSLGYDGDVYVPEDEDGHPSAEDYDEQFDWENEGLERADIIVFWVPRDLKVMPAFTTNHEHGEYFRFGKSVLGAPGFRDTPKMRYLMRKGAKVSQPQAETLEGTLRSALELIGDGAFRSGGETCIPLHLWRTTSFQTWYRAICAVGKSLIRARVEWTSGERSGREAHASWVITADLFEATCNRLESGVLIMTP